MEYIVGLILVGALLVGILRTRFDFTIRCTQGEVTFQGKFPRSRHAEIEEFFSREFREHGKFTVKGKIRNTGQLSLKIRGDLSPGERQQIRNFFISLL